MATDNCKALNKEFPLIPKIEPFMVGRVVGIIDEKRYLVTVQVFPNKSFVYKKDRTFLAPFISFQNVGSSTWPRFKRPSRQLIEKYFVKVIKSKNFRKIVKFLRYEFFSSK